MSYNLKKGEMILENLLQIMPWVWGAMIVMTIVIEIFTVDIDSLWFSVAGAVSLVLSLLGVHVIWQLVAFFSISILLMFTIGRFAKKVLAMKNVATNADSLIGREIKVLEKATDKEKGKGIINDVVWTLLCMKSEKVVKGETAIIVAIDGNKLIVTKENNNDSSGI